MATRSNKSSVEKHSLFCILMTWGQFLKIAFVTTAREKKNWQERYEVLKKGPNSAVSCDQN